MKSYHKPSTGKSMQQQAVNKHPLKHALDKNNIDFTVRNAFAEVVGITLAGGENAAVVSQNREKNALELAIHLSQQIPSKIDAERVNNKYAHDFRQWLAFHRRKYQDRHNQKITDEHDNQSNLTKYNLNNYIFNLLRRAFGKKIATHVNPDLDGLAAEFLLKLVKFTPYTNKHKKIGHKDILPGYLHLDVSGKMGMVVESKKDIADSLGGFVSSSISIDHHLSKKIDNVVYHGASSATQMVFTMLDELQKVPLKYRNHMRRFVDFVNTVDSGGIEILGRDFANSHKTLFGLQRLILKNPKNIEFIYQYFENPAHGGLEIWSDQYMKETEVYAAFSDKKVPLYKLSQSKLAANNEGVAKAEQLLDQDMYVSSPLNGECFIVDLEGDIINGPEVANHLGCGLIKVLPDGKLFIYSAKHMDLDDKTWSTFGDYTRGHLLFIDSHKIPHWNEVEKVLFDDPTNQPVLQQLRQKINATKKEHNDVIYGFNRNGDIGNHSAHTTSGTVKSIKLGMVGRFLKKYPQRPQPDFVVGGTYPAIVNNVTKKMLFVTLPGNQTAVIKKDKDDVGLPAGTEINVAITHIWQDGEKVMITAEPRLQAMTEHEKNKKTG